MTLACTSKCFLPFPSRCLTNAILSPWRLTTLAKCSPMVVSRSGGFSGQRVGEAILCEAVCYLERATRSSSCQKCPPSRGNRPKPSGAMPYRSHVENSWHVRPGDIRAQSQTRSPEDAASFNKLTRRQSECYSLGISTAGGYLREL